MTKLVMSTISVFDIDIKAVTRKQLNSNSINRIYKNIFCSYGKYKPVNRIIIRTKLSLTSGDELII